MNDIVFEITQDADGGFSAECLTESIFTQGDNWEELRANVKEAVDGFYFDRAKPKHIRLHVVRDGMLETASAWTGTFAFRMKIPRNLDGLALVAALTRHWGYKKVNQEAAT